MTSRQKRNPYIDLLKGMLILFVIAGHLLVGGIRTTFPRYLIYSFHMPLFIALSGYLIRPEGLLSLSFPALLRKYFHRLLLPWLIAVQIFYLVTHLTHMDEISFMDYLSSYWDIYFHLWYVPALLVWILLTWGFLKLWSAGKKDAFSAETDGFFLPLLLFALLISLFFCIYYILPLEGTLAARVQYLVYHDLHLLYYIYFIFGMYLRKHPLQKNRSTAFLLAIGCFLIYLLLFPKEEQPLIEHALKFVFNINLAAVLFGFFQRKTPAATAAGVSTDFHMEGRQHRDGFSLFNCLSFIGQHSLAFYLYVQLGKSLFAQFVSWKESPLLYALAMLGSSFLLMGLITWLLRFGWAKRYMGGES